jgi:hypothetical protein
VCQNSVIAVMIVGINFEVTVCSFGKNATCSSRAEELLFPRGPDPLQSETDTRLSAFNLRVANLHLNLSHMAT